MNEEKHPSQNSDSNVDPSPVRMTPDEILGELLVFWWQKRLLIAKIVAIAVIVFAAILLLIPNRYRAESKIIILPPKFSAEIRTEPLSVITAKNLLLSSELVESLIHTIRDAKPLAEKFIKQYDGAEKAAKVLRALGKEGVQKKLGENATQLAPFFARWSAQELQALADLSSSEIEDWTIESLSKSLDCEEIIEKKTAADIKISPLLNLYATARTGSLAQLLVNTWAMLFEQKYDQLANEKTRFQYDYILAQQKEAERTLAQQQQLIVEFKAKNNLELLLREIDEYSSDYKNYLNQLIEKRHKYEVESRKLKELQEAQRVLTEGGLWVGELSAEEIMDPEKIADATTATQSITDFSKSPYEQARAKTLELRTRVLYYLTKLAKFQLEQPVELLDKELNQLQSDYLSAVGKLRSAETRLAVLKSALSALDIALSATEKIISLSKDVPDISIAEAIRTGQSQQLKALSRIQFQREEINPAWTLLFEQRAKLEAEYHEVVAEVAELQPKVKEYERQARELQVRVYRARLAEKMLTDSVESRRKSLQGLLQSYLDTRNQIHDMALQLGILDSEIKQLERETTETKAMVERLQQRYNEASAQLQLMEIQLRAVQRNADLLTQKLQDARMAIAQPVSDVSIAAFAPTPAKHYFPPRTILLVALTTLTIIVVLTVLGRMHYLEIVRR